MLIFETRGKAVEVSGEALANHVELVPTISA
jgi:hypothetical protein